jgi:tetratricopeptide (TPR) repeat protein
MKKMTFRGVSGGLCLVMAGFLAIPTISFSQDTPAQQVVVPDAQILYSVCVGSFSDVSESTQVANNLTTLGYTPVWQRQGEDSRTQVLVGCCDYMPDAVLLCNSIREKGYSDVWKIYIPPTEWSESVPSIPGLVIPDEPLLVPSSTTYPSTFQVVDLSVQPALAAFNTALIAGDDTQVIAEGRAVLETLDKSDAARGRVELELGKAVVREGGKAAPAMDHFLAVARGEVAANADDQMRARLCAADSWHYYYFKPVKARQAYAEIIAAHGSDVSIKSRCMVETLACLLESARSEAATFDEVRRYTAQIHLDVPAEYEKTHAVADLIAGESLFYEGKYDEAITALEGVRADYPNRIRERSMASMFLGEIYFRLKKWDLCQHYYNDVIAADFSDPEENFYWAGEKWNLPKRAAQKIADYAQEFLDTDTRESYLSKIENGDYDEPAQATEQTTIDTAFPHGFYEKAVQ